MNAELLDIDWKEAFDGFDVQSMWDFFILLYL